MHRFVYLASQSPRRRQLLDQIGVPYQMLLPDSKENVEKLEEERSHEAPRDYVQRVAKLKLEAARRRLQRRGLPEAPILSADTTVVLGRRILGKPANPADAAAMLGSLAGRSHRVMTAVMVSHGSLTLAALSISRVRFTALSHSTIEAYVASGEPRGKAGAYAIQSQAAAWVEHIDGSYSGIMGLPLYETAQLLRQARVLF
jgi:septum formation protein